MKQSTDTLRLPLITISTICLCLALQVYGAIDPLALRPASITESFGSDWSSFIMALPSFVTYIFLHQSIGHFISNIVPFSMLGLALENAIGRGRYAIFLALTGLGASLTQYFASPLESLPIIGLSGVVMALLALFVLAAPRLTLFSLPLVKFTVSLRLWHLAMVITYMQLHGFFYGGGVAGHDHTAYMIHLGGAVSGILLWLFWLKDKIQAYRQTAAGARLFA